MYDTYKDVLSFTQEELREYLEGMGHKKFRAKQIYEWLHKKLVSEWDDMTNVPKELRNTLAAGFDIYPLHILEKVVSKVAGTAKYLMAANDGGVIESVAMNYSYGMSVCISSQVGCRMGCSFCASTLAGLERSLSASEMLSQIYLIQKDMGKRVDNIVIMGIGEPFDNYEQVIKFLKMISDESGLNISQRSITVSTCGLVDNMYRFADEHMAVTLAVSLHAPNDELRKRIMPVANKYSVDEIIKACHYYVNTSGRRVTFEYSMIAGVNDTKECADELSARLKGLLCHVNLIPLNDVLERNHKRSTDEGIHYFQKYLEKNRINVTIRKGMGADIDAACGQLRKKYIDNQYR